MDGIRASELACTKLALGQFIKHLDILLHIEELVLVEFVRLYYEAPPISVGVVVN